MAQAILRKEEITVIWGFRFPCSVSLKLCFGSFVETCHFNSKGAAVLPDKLIERDSLNKRFSVLRERGEPSA